MSGAGGCRLAGLLDLDVGTPELKVTDLGVPHVRYESHWFGVRCSAVRLTKESFNAGGILFNYVRAELLGKEHQQRGPAASTDRRKSIVAANINNNNNITSNSQTMVKGKDAHK